MGHQDDTTNYDDLDCWARDNVLVDGLAKDLANNLILRKF